MVEEIDPEDVKRKLSKESNVQVVDIRDEEDFKRGHIPGAINIPLSRLPIELDNYEWADDIVVACPMGESSIQAARLINSFEGVPSDAKVRSMRGGYREWRYELETDGE